jgi:hypothetical protein
MGRSYRHMPKGFKFLGRQINTDRFLILHEAVEKALIVPPTLLARADEAIE